jgi:HlyD family secretion protein
MKSRFIHSSLNRTIAGLSGSKAGLTQADAQYKKLKQVTIEIKHCLTREFRSDWDKAIAFDVAKSD